jgi:hypothetical protein
MTIAEIDISIRFLAGINFGAYLILRVASRTALKDRLSVLKTYFLLRTTEVV